MAGVAPGSQQSVVNLVIDTLKQLSLPPTRMAPSPVGVAPDTFIDDLAGATMTLEREAEPARMRILHSQLGSNLKATPVHDTDVPTVVQDALSETAILAGLNTIEFRLREANSGRPRGLFLMLKAMRWWNYDRNPLAGSFFNGISG